ncbi:penicillin-insensitive murein endopeptidase [Marinicella sp. W31]|uniref:penicillin-insensitive murein endopeptidase n=1 Tax=Marinicella sp. W31 TaxID=3023713 RepID=UPI00375706DC
MNKTRFKENSGTACIHLLFVCILITMHMPSGQASSKCYGSVSDGSLQSGKKLPVEGDNYQTYSQLGSLLGRTYVHSVVHNIVLETYSRLYESHPQWRFTYGETGFEQGGPFSPHKTHQNGLSVDFFVPINDQDNQSVFFPADVSNKLGYAFEFSPIGSGDGLTINFEAMAKHLMYLDQVSKEMGYGVKKVIFDPTLQQLLFDTQAGAYLKKNIQFNKNPVWVRHDEHYHVDFDVACDAL